LFSIGKHLAILADIHFQQLTNASIVLKLSVTKSLKGNIWQKKMQISLPNKTNTCKVENWRKPSFVLESFQQMDCW
jgi:hypothetical protein